MKIYIRRIINVQFIRDKFQVNGLIQDELGYNFTIIYIEIYDLHIYRERKYIKKKNKTVA